MEPPKDCKTTYDALKVKEFKRFFNIGLVVLSSDFRVIGINQYAQEVLRLAPSDLGKSVFHHHTRKSRQKIDYLLRKSSEPDPDMPLAMIIDVLNKVLMINLCRLDMSKDSPDSLFAMTFVDVTEQTQAQLNPSSGMVELKKFPVYHRNSFMFIDPSSIYFIESDGNYCKIYTEDRSYHVHHTLKSILERYTGTNFFRAHKSFIANLSYIRKITRTEEGKSLIAFDKASMPFIPVARRRIGDLKKVLAVQ